MKKLILIVGAAALATTAPALAQGNSHAKHGKAHAGHASKGKGAKAARDGSGRLWALNSRGACPPGLAKKNNGCMAPGQAKKMYSAGQRYNRNFGTTWGYNQIPIDLRNQYSFDQNDRYYYNQG